MAKLDMFPVEVVPAIDLTDDELTVLDVQPSLARAYRNGREESGFEEVGNESVSVVGEGLKLFWRDAGDDELFEFVSFDEFKLERLFSLNDENLNRDVMTFSFLLPKYIRKPVTQQGST